MATAKKRKAAARTAKGSSFCNATCNGHHKMFTAHLSVQSMHQHVQVIPSQTVCYHFALFGQSAISCSCSDVSKAARRGLFTVTGHGYL